MALCLLVGDKAALIRPLEAGLSEAGHVVLRMQAGPAAVNLLRSEPRLVVLLAYLSGPELVEMCRLFRSASSVVGIVALATGNDGRLGYSTLKAGADVYLPGPISSQVVVAAMEALVRRMGETSSAVEWPDRVVVNELELDLARGTLRCRNRRVDLTPSEFRILRHLAVNAGRVLPNEVLVREALGHTTSRKDASDILKVHIRHLREKIEVDPSRPTYLLNVRGLGYMLERRRRGGRARGSRALAVVDEQSLAEDELAGQAAAL